MNRREIFVLCLSLLWIVSLLAAGGCTKSPVTTGTLLVTCSKDQMEIWNAFVQESKSKDWATVVFYTQKQTPIKSLTEVKADEFATCGFFPINALKVMNEMLGHKGENYLKVNAGLPRDLRDIKLHLYLASQDCEKDLDSSGWVRTELVAK